MKAGSGKIKTAIFVPLGLAVLALLVVSIVSIYWQQQQHLNKGVQGRLEQVRRLLEINIREDSRILNTITDFVQNDKNIRAAWLERDRDALLTSAEPVLKNIRDKYGVTHLYFHDSNEVCFLRVHDPRNYGDRVNRFTVDEVIRKKETVYGIALGTYGAFSLRFAQPWHIDDKLVGYVELGRKIEHIASDLKESLDVELFFVMKKTCLSRPNWEQGQRAAGRNGNWELLQNLVITDSTLGQVPQKFPAIVDNAYMTHKTTLFDIPAENKTYRAGFVPLLDAAGREVGNIVVMRDITQNQAILRNLLTLLVFAAVLIGGSLLGIFYWYISRIENSIASARETDMEKRTHPQTNGRRAQDKIETTV